MKERTQPAGWTAYRKQLEGSLLFRQMEQTEIDQCLACSGAKTVSYAKEELLFNMGDTPQRLYVLLKGAVAVCRDSAAGQRQIINTFQQPGELFGEVFVFLPEIPYSTYTVAQKDCTVLEMPRSFFFASCAEGCGHHAKLMQNMLLILAEKAYLLNQKLQLVAGTSLRQRISRTLLEQCSPDNTVRLQMNREAMADFLGTTRPSLSRELMKMQEEGLIHIKGSHVRIVDRDGMEQYL